MFRCGDKLTLSCVNVVNRDGKIVDYNLSFPLEDSDFDIPNDVVEVSIFEAHDDVGYISFKILVGEITDIEKICEDKYNAYMFDKRAFNEIKSIDDRLCYYYDPDGFYYVFAKVNEGDIVVSNIEELKMELIYISNHFKNIKDSIATIRDCECNDYSIPSELSDKRLEMCINRRIDE